MPSIKFNPREFVVNFVNPLNKVNDAITIYAEPDRLYSIASNKESGTILYAIYNSPQSVEGIARFNFNNITKFNAALQCISDDVCELIQKNNYIEYKSSEIKFKYFLTDDLVMPQVKINPKKIDSIQYDYEFVISQEVYVGINKAKTFADGIEKAYIYCRDGIVYINIDDKELSHANSMEIAICEIEKPFDTTYIIKKDFFSFLGGIRFEKIKVMVNKAHSILQFAIDSDDVTLRYIVQTIVK